MGRHRGRSLAQRMALTVAVAALVGLASAAGNVAGSLAASRNGTATASFPNAHTMILRWEGICPIPVGSNPSFHYWYVDVLLTHADGASTGSGPLYAPTGSTQASGGGPVTLSPDPPGAKRDTVHWVVRVHCNGIVVVIGHGTVEVTAQGVSPSGGDQGGGGSGAGGGNSGTSGGGGGVVCRVPALVGRKLAAAKLAITAAHCRVGKVTRIHAAGAKKGRVLSQSPQAGKIKPAGTKVRLAVAK